LQTRVIHNGTSSIAIKLYQLRIKWRCQDIFLTIPIFSICQTSLPIREKVLETCEKWMIVNTIGSPLRT